ncbi:LAQU0S06e02564g1_1 [Lachancea quebecensis]|uniref:Anaphase-promoting complex subunit 11 n=1 Tax=Lachancea quebecensis TaxID=1654605 RepID=A0A0P1KR99_9SACH|nr:LAQU0S06e02564g1_1 [Lachancea quebecensis]
MQLEFKKVYPVFSWSWDIPGDDGADREIGDEDLCGICRVSYNGTCPGCKYPGDNCPLVIGDCNHNFHVHCIQQWLATPTAKGLCPMCRQQFSLKRGVAINEGQVEKLANLLLQPRPAALAADDQDMMMDQEFAVR